MPCIIPDSISNPVKPKHAPPRYTDLYPTSISISESVSSPIVTCLTTAVFAMFFLAAIDRVSDLVLIITIAAKNTEPANLPGAFLYVFAMMSAGYMVQRGLTLVFYKDRLMEDDTLPNRIARFTKYGHPNGGAVTEAEFVSDTDAILLKYVKEAIVAQYKSKGDAKPEETKPEPTKETKTEANKETKPETNEETKPETNEEPAAAPQPKGEQEEITPAPRRTLKRPIEDDEEECFLMPM